MEILAKKVNSVAKHILSTSQTPPPKNKYLNGEIKKRRKLMRNVDQFCTLYSFITSINTCFQIYFSDDEHEFEVKSTDTVLDLKKMYEEEEGIVPEHQTYFCGPVPVESDEILLSSLIEVFGNTFDVKLTKAAMMQTDKDVMIVFGPSRHKFQKIYLRPGGSKNIKFKKGKFGIVTHTATVGEDNIYTVDRYKLLNDAEQTIKLKSEGDATVAFIVTNDGEEERLMPETMEYKVGNPPMERVKDVVRIGANIGQVISAVGTILDWGKY